MSAIIISECLGDRIEAILPDRPENAITATEMRFWLGASTGRIRDACRTLQSYQIASPEVKHVPRKNGKNRPVLHWWLSGSALRGSGTELGGRI